MKRIVSLVLALSMVLSMFTTAFAGTSIKDVEGTDYEAAVSALVELGIVSGYEDGTYQPKKVVTRAEMAKLLVISAGLEPAADVSKGATNFSDVPASHWATGYINVASQYGYINGYPDGTFAPDATVTYAEAVTMAIRVLGYKSVVEAKGTWPTNYIAKAQELKVLKDVGYKSYSDGAVRGNVALVIWNMLRTNMWDVKEENENAGLTYGDAKITMIDKYFEDYTYTTAEFSNFTIDDGEVKMFFTLIEDEEELENANKGYEYAGNDFYTFVYGTEVEVLVNEDDETLLMIVPTGADKLVEGTKEVIDEDYDEISGDSYDYAYARIEKKKIDASTQLTVDSKYVYELDDSSKKSVKINGKSYKDEDYEDTLIIVDGVRGTIRDIEEGDILSKVTVDEKVFYIVSCDEAEGKLTKIVVEDYDNVRAGTYTVATVGGKEYLVAANATYVEDPDDEDEDASAFDSHAWEPDMKNEEVVLKLDFLGRVVAVEFDGEIGGDSDDYTVGFYAISETVEKASSRKYTICLENEDGSDEYTFANGEATELAKSLYLADNDLAGYYAVVTFDDDNNIENIVLLANASGDGAMSGEQVSKYAYDDKNNFVIVSLTSGEFDDKDMEINAKSGDEDYTIDVTEDVVIVTLVFDDKGTTKTSDDEFRVEFSEGTKAIAKLKNEKILVIYDDANKFAEAKYVVLFDEVSDREDDLIAIVDTVATNRIGELIITLIDAAGEKAELIVPKNTVSGEFLSAYEMVMYSKEENKDKEEEFTFITGITKAQLTSGDAAYEALKYVSEVANDGKKAIVSGEEYNTTKESFKDKYEDYTFIIVEVVEDDETTQEGVYVADTFTTKAYDTVRFKVGDRVHEDKANEVVTVIRGMIKID